MLSTLLVLLRMVCIFLSFIVKVVFFLPSYSKYDFCLTRDMVVLALLSRSYCLEYTDVKL